MTRGRKQQRVLCPFVWMVHGQMVHLRTWKWETSQRHDESSITAVLDNLAGDINQRS